MSEPVESPVLATIVHLSDLHFGKVFDSSLGRLLLAYIPPLHPDVVIVSGDLADNPRPRWVRGAARYLDRLLEQCRKPDGKRPDLVVVPGNHDRKILGNLTLGFLSRLIFEVYFGGKSGDFRLFPWHERWHRYAAILLYRVWKTFRQLWAPADAADLTLHGRVLAGGNLTVLPYDSNDTYWLASGRVVEQQLSETEFGLLRLEGEAVKPDPLALRIAVLHHHPIAIPYADVRKLTNMESFLVLDNAGTFMREMVTNDVDLVLHGHKHYSNFSRVSYQLGPNERSEVGVLSAGTAAVRGGNHFGKNSYNVIRLYKQTRVEVEIWEYGAGRTRQYASHTPYPFELNTREGLKARAFRRNLRVHEVKAQSLTVTKRLDFDGRFLLTMELKGLTAGNRGLTGYRIGFLSPTGLMRKVGVDRASSLAGLSWKRDEDPSASGDSLESRLARERKVRGEIRFNRALGRLDMPVDFNFSFYAINGDAMSDWEFELLYPPEMRRAPNGEPFREPKEWLAQAVWHPLERLILCVELPRDITEAPYVDVFCNSAVPRKDLVEGSLLRPPTTEGDRWERDAYMREGEQQNLRRIGENTWRLEVDHPPMGYLYSINWFLPRTTSGDVPSKLIAEADTFRRLLLRHRKRRLSQEAPTEGLVKLVRDSFALYYEIFRRSFPCIDLEERFDMSLMTYDADGRRMLVVEGLMNGRELPPSYWDFWLPPGVGNAGTSFKTGQSCCYVAPEVLPEFNYYLAVDEKDPHQVLVSVPLDHPKFELPDSDEIASERKRQVVGVMNLGSNCASSTLRRLFPSSAESEEQAQKHMEELQRICQSALNIIWSILACSTRPD